MPKSKPASTPRPTVAYSADRKVTLAPVACPHCGRELHATAVEVTGNGDVRLVCPGCYRDLLTIEGQ